MLRGEGGYLLSVASDDSGPVRLNVALLAEEWSIIDDDIWGVGPINPRDVLTAIAQGRTLSEPYSHSAHEWAYENHVARIAHLAVHGWTDPIEVDVGIPSMGYTPRWPIQDGNHRFLAAFVMGDAWIWADMQGEVNEIDRLTVADACAA